ncbi:MAG TPA: hypothetical protein VKG45_09030 [Actinomycetes bacterium]|nr:hypothetical protein [Actinomycetes bacterium]
MPLRVLLVTLALAGLAACDAADDARQGVGKASDCAELVKAVADVRIDPQATADEVERRARDAERAVENADSEDVKRAGRRVVAELQRLAEAVDRSDQADVDRELQRVRQAAEDLARTCNVPVDQVLG